MAETCFHNEVSETKCQPGDRFSIDREIHTIILPKDIFNPFPPWRALLRISCSTSSDNSSCMTWIGLLSAFRGPFSVWDGAESTSVRPLSGMARGTMLGTSAIFGVWYSCQGVDGRATVRKMAAVTAFCREPRKPFVCEQKALWRGGRVQEAYERSEMV